jgi:predicted metal-dependent hydrolase
MDYHITYKHIRNGYVKIDSDGSLQITIPTRLKNDEKFKNALIKKGETLLKRYSKRTHIQCHGDDFVMLFGELVPKSQLPKIKNLKTYLQETLAEYSKPLLDKYSQIIDYKYHKLIIRVTHSKR